MENALNEGKLVPEEERDRMIKLAETATDDHLREAWPMLSHINLADVMQILIDWWKGGALTKEHQIEIQKYFFMITTRNEMLRRGILVEIRPAKSP